MAKDSDSNDNDDDVGPDPRKDRISSTLKRVYDDVASEPLPDKLVDLLDSLKKSGGGASDGDAK